MAVSDQAVLNRLYRTVVRFINLLRGALGEQVMVCAQRLR